MFPVEFLAPSGLGLEVEPRKISSSLKKLWEQGEGVVTRASLINLAIYSEEPSSLDHNSEIAAEITQDHSCRVILVERDLQESHPDAKAWITAHCHVSGAGGKQVCCEQVAYRISSDGHSLLANTVLGSLDSDLPLVLWWQPDFPEAVSGQLWSRVDRLIFDSKHWTRVPEQFRAMKEIQATGPKHVTFCDINWGRLLALRLALAQLHDHPGASSALFGLQKLEIHHGKQGRLCAAMLAGWFCRQLGWKMEGTRDQPRLADPETGAICEILYHLTEEENGVSKVRGEGGYTFSVEVNENRDLVLGQVHLADGHRFQFTAPRSRQETATLVSQELERGSEHRIYPEILEIVSPLFA